jgi:excisionase family DNA binding protein
VDIEKPLTVEQAAELIGISRAHLYALIRQGQFPVVRFGKLTRVAPEALRNFIAAGGTIPHQPRPTEATQ